MDSQNDILAAAWAWYCSSPLFLVAVDLSPISRCAGWRLDLTENRLYTLSDGTYAVLERHPGDRSTSISSYSDAGHEQTFPQLRTYAGPRARNAGGVCSRTPDGQPECDASSIPCRSRKRRTAPAEFGLQSDQTCAQRRLTRSIHGYRRHQQHR